MTAARSSTRSKPRGTGAAPDARGTAKEQLGQLLANAGGGGQPADTGTPARRSRATRGAQANASARNKAQDATPPADPPAQPPAAQPPAAPAVPAKPVATVTAMPFDRFIGVATLGDVTTRCTHADKNGHITEAAALKCASPLAKALGEGATTSVETRSRYNVAITATVNGEVKTASDESKFGHKTPEQAVESGKRVARQLGYQVAADPKPAEQSQAA